MNRTLVLVIFASLLAVETASANPCGNPCAFTGDTVSVEAAVTVESGAEVRLVLPSSDWKSIGGIVVQPWQLILGGLFISLAVVLVLGRPGPRRARVKRALALGAATSLCLVLVASSCGTSGSSDSAKTPVTPQRVAATPTKSVKNAGKTTLTIVHDPDVDQATLSIPEELCGQ